jgi:hypothetical protein
MLRLRPALGCAAALIGALTLPACGDTGCPMILAEKTIRVLDQNGGPVEGLTVDVIHVRTGNSLDLSDASADVPGDYVILTSDHVMDGPVRDGDRIEVTASLEHVVFVETYTVRTDRARCHPTGMEGELEVRVEL